MARRRGAGRARNPEQRLALDIIGSAVFSLDMDRYAPELRELILRYAARLGRPSLADLLLPLAGTRPSRGTWRTNWPAST